MDKAKQYIYYILIGIISVIMLIFIPMMGSEAGLAWVIPTTVSGWIVYVITKIASAAFNISIFHCFNKQGKQNILTHPGYLEAQNLLLEADENLAIHLRSPKEFHRYVYGKKGLTIVLTSILGAVGLSQAVLSFDIASFITQLIVMVFGIIAGILQMKTTEEYWTIEYLEYAKDINRKHKEVENNVQI